MCEQPTVKGGVCPRPSRYMVNVRTVPQLLGVNGEYGMESSPAGRSRCVCSQHVAAAVDHLNALPIVAYGATPTVRRFRA